MLRVIINHIKSCTILAFKSILPLFIVQTVYSQSYPNWSTEFDYMGYGNVKTTCELQNGNLYLAKNNDQSNVYIDPDVILFDKTTNQLINQNGSGFGLVHINDMKLMNDSILFIAGLASNTSNVHKIYRKNISSSSWQQICQSDKSINCIEIYNNKLYFGGAFTLLNGVNYTSFATYNPYNNSIDSIPNKLYYPGFGNSPIINCLKSNSLGLIIGGKFIGAGPNVLNSIALYDTTGWHDLNNGLQVAGGSNSSLSIGTITSITIDNLNPLDITVAGNFNYFGTQNYQNYYSDTYNIISKWNNSLNKWDTIPHFKDALAYQYVNGPQYLSDIKYYNNELYLAYNYPRLDGKRLIKINATAWSFLPLRFTDDIKEGCNLSTYDGDLLISSYHSFPFTGTVRYNSTGTYRSFGNGMNFHDLYAKEGNDLFICNGAYGETGEFHACSGSTMSSVEIMKYDISTMKYDSIQSHFQGNSGGGGGLIQGLYSKGDSLIALGYFTSNTYAPGVDLNSAAVYRKSTRQWLPLINSVYTTSLTGTWGTNYFRAIAFYGNGFFIGGDFTINSNQNLQNLVYWNGTSFDSLKLMPHSAGYINCLEISHDTLWVGGKFTGSKSKNFAAYKISTKQWIPTSSFYDGGNNDCEINKIDIYKNKIFIVGNNITRHLPYGAWSATILPDTSGSCGYIPRNNLNIYQPFTKFKKYSSPNFENQYIKNDSTIFLMGRGNFRSSGCNSGNATCDSSGGIVKYNYITNEFDGYYEAGVSKHNNDDCTVKYMTEYNNQQILFGDFDKAGYNLNSINIAALRIGPSMLISVNELQKLNESDHIIIYPNPTNGIFEIKIKNQIKGVEVYDFMGKSVLQSNSAQLDIKDSSSGIYLVKVTDIHNKTYTGKVILNN